MKMSTASNNKSVEKEVSIRDLILSVSAWFRFIRSRWIALLFAGLIGGAVGLGYAYVKTPLYTATTTFVLESGDSKGGIGRLAGVAALAGIDLTGDAGGLFQGDNILELYRSRTMIVHTLLSRAETDSSQLLIERYLNFTKLNKNWEKDSVLSKLDFSQAPSQLTSDVERARDSVLSRLANEIRDNILVVEKPEPKLSIIKVDVVSPDEVFSKAFNDNLVKRVNDFYIQTKTKKTVQSIALLEAKVDSVRRVMESAIYSAIKVSDATPNLNPTRQVQRAVPAQEAQFTAEANKAILSQLIQNLELSRMTLAQEQPLIQIVDQPVYPLPVNRLGKLKGIVSGGILAVFFTLLFLIISRWYKAVMTAEQ